MIWWIIVGVLVLLALIYIQIEHHAKKYKIILLVVVGLVLYLSVTSVFKANDIDLTSPGGIMDGTVLYFGWLGQTASSLWDIGTDTASLVGNAIKTNSSED